MRYIVALILIIAVALMSAANPQEDLQRVNRELSAVEQQIELTTKDITDCREKIIQLQEKESALQKALGDPLNPITSTVING